MQLQSLSRDYSYPKTAVGLTVSFCSLTIFYKILKAAADGNYGVLATVAYNIEHILGMIHAAELAHSPLIVQFFPWAITFSSVLLIRTAANAASRAKVPVAVHLDHAQDEEQGVEMVVRQTMEWMEICGSSGRAKGNFGVIKDGSI